MFIVRLAGDHLYWEYLFTWVSLVMSLMASFCAVLFPTRCCPFSHGSLVILDVAWMRSGT